MRKVIAIQECCEPVLRAPLERDGAEQLAAGFAVLADSARLRLLSLIASQGEACVCNLTEPLGLSQPTVSHHLKVLTEAGLLERQQRGRWAYFRVVPDSVRILQDALEQPAGAVV